MNKKKIPIKYTTENKLNVSGLIKLFADHYKHKLIITFGLFQQNQINFIVAKFSLDGSLKNIQPPNLFCKCLDGIKFGYNVKKQCKIFAKDLSSREMNFYVPFLLYVDEKGKTYLSALPVFAKSKIVSIYIRTV